LPELRQSVFCSPRSPNKPRECTGKCRQFNQRIWLGPDWFGTRWSV
jgi:hypothetical protein